jgi:hypothetical protein
VVRRRRPGERPLVLLRRHRGRVRRLRRRNDLHLDFRSCLRSGPTWPPCSRA